MPNDYYDQIVAILRRHGCVLVRTGRHALWYSPVNNRTFRVPASKSRHTANEVLKQAGLARLSGPSTVVDADAAVGLFLVFHELATNATKYGALSVSAGSVEVSWRRDAEQRLQLAWVECDGPAVMPPSREGFGTTLLDRIVRRSLNGTIEMRYPATGVCADIALQV